MVTDTPTKTTRGAPTQDDEPRDQRWPVVSTKTDLDRLNAVKKDYGFRSRNDLVLYLIRTQLDIMARSA